MNPLRTIPSCRHRQRGVALMVMLVILIMGVTFFLVSALSKISLQTTRNEQSADLLAQAKDVITGYLISESGPSNPPGWMMFPDVLSNTETPRNYDGVWNSSGCFNIDNAGNPPPYTPLTMTPSKMRCLGRVPWKSLGMSISTPSENDPLGVMPWYAFSTNLMNASLPINSELLNVTTNWLTVRDMKGNVLSNRVAFLIIIPGPPLQEQARPSSPNLGGPSQYLDSITVPNPCTAPCVSGTYSNFDFASHDPFTNGFIVGDEHRWIDDPANPGQQIDDPTYHFNDKLLYVTIDDLMPLIEKRIARGVKACLDDYAAASGGKYPWAAKVADPDYVSRTWSDLSADSAYLAAQTSNIRFGRIPVSPTINTTTPAGSSTDPNVVAAKNALIALQAAEIACQNDVGSQTALATAGTTLINALTQITSPPFSSTFITRASAAGNAPNTVNGNCNYIETHGSTNSVQTNLTSAVNAFNSTTISTPEDPAMQSSWNWSGPTTSCNTLFSSSYWDDWKNLVFYQVDSRYQPNGSTSACANNCLSIGGSGNPDSGSGNYRAVVIVAGKKLGAQTRPPLTDANNYLSNTVISEQSTDPAFTANAHDNAGTSTSFITYRPSDPYYQNVNDLVLCLDGKNNCK